jgi:hypothetical protein
LIALLTFSLFLPPQAAASSERGFHTFIAVSQNLRWPGSLRIGWRDWEVGQITSYSVGVNKVFDMNDRSYAALGLIVASTAGVYGGIGFKFSWAGFGLRGELTSIFDASGFSQGLGLLGVTYGF